MPELPEVETIVREMREAGLEGIRITHAIIFWPRSIAHPSVEEFSERIAHQTIQQIHRRGKYIVITLSQDTLLVHLRMTGKFILSNQPEEGNHAHERVRLHLADERYLRYEDQRKFGKWYLVHNPQDILDQLGLEPLSSEFSLIAFQKLLRKHNNTAKAFLLNQHYIAGLGNIYVDEALWEAQIHPLRYTQTLSQPEIIALHQAILKVLQIGVDNIGTSLGSHRANYFSISGRRGGNQYKLNVFRRDSLPCPRCQNTIIKIVVAQRGTHLCPHCQHL